VKVGIFANTGKASTPETLKTLREEFVRRGIEEVFEAETAAALGEGKGVPGRELGGMVDVVAVLGGDGTMLAAVQKLGAVEIPVAGVNTGRLGFLTTCTDDAVGEFAEALSGRRFSVSERTLLEIEFWRAGSDTPLRFTALNEVVVARGHSGRLVSLHASIDGGLLNDYRADGLIVSTPTGSTAYSLSSGGPLISPDARVFVITPICPHTLSHRSLVVDDEATIELAPDEAPDAPLMFTVDGRDCLSMEAGGRVVVRKAGWKFQLVRLEGHSFYEALRRKLNWRGG
jgi:NAD+ kinase